MASLMPPASETYTAANLNAPPRGNTSADETGKTMKDLEFPLSKSQIVMRSDVFLCTR